MLDMLNASRRGILDLTQKGASAVIRVLCRVAYVRIDWIGLFDYHAVAVVNVLRLWRSAAVEPAGYGGQIPAKAAGTAVALVIGVACQRHLGSAAVENGFGRDQIQKIGSLVAGV